MAARILAVTDKIVEKSLKEFQVNQRQAALESNGELND